MIDLKCQIAPTLHISFGLKIANTFNFKNLVLIAGVRCGVEIEMSNVCRHRMLPSSRALWSRPDLGAGPGASGKQ